MAFDRGMQPPDRDDKEYDVVENILAWVVKNYRPEDIYTSGQLDEWAIRNGYLKTQT